MITETRVCARTECENEFAPERSTQRFCSSPCRVVQAGREQRKRQRDRAPVVTASCEFCNESFTPADRRQRFCSTKCRERRHVQNVRRHENGDPVMPGDLVTCEYCEEAFVLPEGKGQRRFCSLDCRRAAKSERHYPRPAELPCVDCGAMVEQQRMGKHRRRCDPCRAAESARLTQDWMRRNPDHMRNLWAKGKHKRRALILALPSESISPLDIYERDGWTCGICTEPMDRDLRYPDPMSPSLDHIVPLSKGGHHVRDNVQASHLLCNVIKNDTMEMV